MLRGWLTRSGSGSSIVARSATTSRLAAHLPRLVQHPQQQQFLHIGSRASAGGAAALLQHAAVHQRRRQQQQPLLSPTACQAGGSSSTLEIGRPYASKATPIKPAASFEELPLPAPLLEALKAAGLTTPTDIQSMAIPAILGGGDLLLAAQTGSGKTLAYLLPMVAAFKAAEGEPGMERRARRPKMLVLAPTKELSDQITSVAKSLCHFAKFRAVACTAFSSDAQLSKLLAPPVDLVVATPTKLQQLLDANNLTLGDVRWLVVDEADTMLAKGFLPEVTRVVAATKAKPQPAQALLVSATMTKAVQQLATSTLPGLARIETAGLHHPVSTASHEFRALEPGGDKIQLLLELLQGDVTKRRKVLVFCSSMDSCRAVEHSCQDRDLPTVCYHGDMPIDARRESMAAFAGAAAATAAGAAGGAEGGGSSSGSARPASIMVATDLAARGLDFPGTIDHVINFDMPSNGIDYLHRAGRTARAGASGRVTSLLQDRRDKRMAQAIQHAMSHKIPLDQVISGSNGKQTVPAAAEAAAPRWQPPQRAKRVKGEAPVAGVMQRVAYSANHKFLHLDPATGEPRVPYKQLLLRKTGDERRKLLWEIAMDTKEYRRLRHAKAVQQSANRKSKTEAKQLQQTASIQRERKVAGKYSPVSADPEERWKAKVANKRAKQAAAAGGGGGGGSGRGGSSSSGGRRGGGGRGDGAAAGDGRRKLFK